MLPEDMLREFQEAVFRKCMDANLIYQASLNKIDQEFYPGSDVAKRLINLIQEEADEVVDALAFGDEESLVKELADLLYVTYNAAAIYGIEMTAAFNRVHENNMLKINAGTLRKDGKLIKPDGHKKPYLGDLI